MATQISITRWCDVHLYEHSEQVEAESRVIPVPGRVLTVDLCDTCDEQILGPVRKVYEEYGAKPEQTPQSSDGVACPVCGRTSPNQSLVRAHIKRMHKEQAAEILDLNGKGLPCDHEGCDFVAIKPQGLGAHKRAAHGVAGTSHTAIHNRELAQSA